MARIAPVLNFKKLGRDRTAPESKKVIARSHLRYSLGRDRIPK